MGYLILILWLTVLPFCAGGLFRTRENRISLSGQWLWGQFLLWAIFQITTVYFVLTQGNLEHVLITNLVLSMIVVAVGLILTGKQWKAGQKTICSGQVAWFKEHKLPVAIFVALWIVQILAILFLAVNDGDDAYYMAVASVAESSENLYTSNVYAFGNTELNYRYALAPFPIWIAFLSRISGVNTLIIGHIFLGISLVTMSYVIYGQIAKELFANDARKRIMTLVWIAVLYIWGNTSSHTAESFLLLRSRQGKALVAGLVIPATIYLLIKTGRALEQKLKISFRDFCLAAVVILVGCLGSTLGGVLVILLWGSGLLFLAMGYKKWMLIPAGILSILPGLVYAVIYVLK